jgi:ferritin-like metal-binding protein YciE
VLGKSPCLFVLLLDDDFGEDRARDVLAGLTVRDDEFLTGLLAAAQAVEHYEMSRYGPLRTWAEELGLRKVVTLLEETRRSSSRRII